MKCFASFALSLWLASTALAGIEVPGKVEVGQQLVASVDVLIPQGATSDVTWKIEGDGTATWLPLSDNGKIAIWATPGVYEITYSGFWLHLKEVSFKDGDGNTITIQSYLGHGSINETATVEVTGGAAPDPGPSPPSPGPEPGAKQLVILYRGGNLDGMTREQREILTGMKARKRLEEAGHVVLEILEDDQLGAVGSRLAPFVNAYRQAGYDLPVLVFSSVAGGKAQIIPLPRDIDAVLEALK